MRPRYLNELRKAAHTASEADCVSARPVQAQHIHLWRSPHAVHMRRKRPEIAYLLLSASAFLRVAHGQQGECAAQAQNGSYQQLGHPLPQPGQPLLDVLIAGGFAGQRGVGRNCQYYCSTNWQPLPCPVLLRCWSAPGYVTYTSLLLTLIDSVLHYSVFRAPERCCIRAQGRCNGQEGQPPRPRDTLPTGQAGRRGKQTGTTF